MTSMTSRSCADCSILTLTGGGVKDRFVRVTMDLFFQGALRESLNRPFLVG